MRGGFAGSKETCGAVAAMGIVVGLARANQDKDPLEKCQVYEDMQKLVIEFTEKNQTSNCKQLLDSIDDLIDGYKPQVNDSSYFITRPCIKFVLDAVEILEKHITNQGLSV
ncbi:MAG: C_GCAxxG_C_C family protein [Clostridiales bacterium]|nr:C_GCAxxG_C_C family protein [Clostridiales bacterium]